MRGHFHRHGTRAGGSQLLQRCLQLERVRRGIAHVAQGAWEAATQRAEDPRPCAVAFERSRDPLAGGGLAVGAGYTADPQMLGGSSMEIGGEHARALLQSAY